MARFICLSFLHSFSPATAVLFSREIYVYIVRVTVWNTCLEISVGRHRFITDENISCSLSSLWYCGTRSFIQLWAPPRCLIWHSPRRTCRLNSLPRAFFFKSPHFDAYTSCWKFHDKVAMSSSSPLLRLQTTVAWSKIERKNSHKFQQHCKNAMKSQR